MQISKLFFLQNSGNIALNPQVVVFVVRNIGKHLENEKNLNKLGFVCNMSLWVL